MHRKHANQPISARTLLSVLLLLLFCLVAITDALAQEFAKGAHRQPLQAITTQGESLDLYRQSHALLIGVSDYNNGWSKLPAIPEELDHLEQELIRKQFNVVRLSNPDARELKQGITDFIDQYGYEPENRLLFFFSGHGHSQSNKGFLVPADAPLPDNRSVFRRRALSMNQFMAWARDIEAKHALFLFDSCFSGSVFKSKNLPSAAERYIRNATARPVRQFITAGSADEVVPARSAFTPALVDALQGDGDLNEDSYITGSELGVHLSQLVPRFVDQTPQYGKIRDYHLAQGDFVFFNDSDASSPEPVPESQPEQASAASTENLLWQSAARGNTIAEYQVYLQQYPDGVFSGIASARIEQLQRSFPQAAPQPETPVPAPAAPTGRLTVNVEPEDARVRIMNIVPRYRPGMELELGNAYDVLVTKSGYESWRRNVKLEEPEQVVVEVVLRKRSLPVVPVKPTRKAFEPEMVLVEGGCFQMGSPTSEKGRDRDERQHRVCVKDVYAGVYEVTFAQYDVYAKATGKRLPDDRGWGRGDRPVINVSWNDATAYAQWLSEQTGKSYRLPTEAEWEYASRGGSGSTYWWGDKIGHNRANCYGCGSGWDNRQTAPVGSFSANAYGLFDTVGNVREWTCSTYTSVYDGSESDCQKNQSRLRMLRGGGWFNGPAWVRSALRLWDGTGSRSNDLGFRVFRDVR